ncbi:MAG: cytidine deaminase [Syntrophomonadaceae bacterium]|nr:cytidine deaminase [Syntrophomonadaceae bacterium]
MDHRKLIELSRQAQTGAYVPYSGFKVGAALLTNTGRIYTGANIENASYGLTVCAERIAVFKAINDGEKEFDCIAITASRGWPYPCGACRQVLAEFSPHMKVIVSDENNSTREYLLTELLPQTFSLDI